MVHNKNLREKKANLKYIRTLVTASCVLSAVIAPNNTIASSVGFYSPELSAKYAAKRTAEFHNVEQLLQTIELGLSKTEAEGVRKAFASQPKAQIPACSASGSRLTCNDGTTIIFNQNRTLTMNGEVIKAPERGKFDLFLEQFAKSHARTSAMVRLLIPRAEANPAIVALALITLSVAFCFADEVYGAAIYLGKDIYQWAKAGTIDCDGKNFAVRHRSKDATGNPGFRLEPLELQVVSQLMQRKLTECTPALSKELRQRIMAAAIAPMKPASGGVGR